MSECLINLQWVIYFVCPACQIRAFQGLQWTDTVLQGATVWPSNDMKKRDQRKYRNDAWHVMGHHVYSMGGRFSCMWTVCYSFIFWWCICQCWSKKKKKKSLFILIFSSLAPGGDSNTPNVHPHASFQQHPLWWQVHSHKHHVFFFK